MRKIDFMKKIIRIKYLLFFIIIVTILFIASNPRILINGDYLKTDYTIYQTSSSIADFCLIPDNTDFDHVIVTVDKRFIVLMYKNIETGNGIYTELPGYSVNSVLGGAPIYIYQENKSAEIIFSHKGADYYLYELFIDSDYQQNRRYKIYTHPLYQELQDTLITMNGITFNGFTITENRGENYEIIENKNKFHIYFNRNFWDEFRKIKIPHVEGNEIYKILAIYFEEITREQFSEADIYEIIHFFIRNNYYQNILFSLDYPDSKGFVGARVVGKLDADRDGVKDYLILISGKRWICDRLLCFSKEKRDVLWLRKHVYGSTDFFNIHDIDYDGDDDIIFSTTAYCNEFPIDWHKNKDVGMTYISYLYILDSQGNIKIINNQPAIIETEPGLNKIHYLPLFDKKKILFGIATHNDLVDRRLCCYDYSINKIDTLDVIYKSLGGFYREGSNIGFFDSYLGILENKIIDDNFKLVSVTKKKMNQVYGLPRCYKKNIEGKEFFILTPFTFMDKNLNILYEHDHGVNFEKTVWKDNVLYFIEKVGDESNFSSIEFTRNREFNPFIILVLVFEISLLVIYFFIKNSLTIPLINTRGNYFILYQIIGKIFYWKLKGNIENSYNLPKKFALTSIIPYRILNNISEQHKVIFSKLSIFLRIKVFEINPTDELLIVQRIAHELKNQALELKLFADHYTGKEKGSVADDLGIQKIVRQISQTAAILSNFAHIGNPYLENINMKLFLENIISSFVNHKNFDKISIKLPTIPVELESDKNLLKIALRNLIVNSLEAINSEGYINITLSYKTDIIQVTISNSISNEIDIDKITQIGYTTKESGSGVGIPVSKTIIEKLHGEFEIRKNSSEIMFLLSFKYKK